MKIALAGLAGVAAAWLLPRGGGAPAPTPSGSPSDRPGVTAVEYQLNAIEEGVSFRTTDRVRVFFVRSGSSLVAFVGSSTTSADGPLYWCPRSRGFEAGTGDAFYDRSGKARVGNPLRDLDRIRVLVSAGRVTVFPHSVTRGAPVTGGLPELYPNPCAPSERVG